MASTSKGNLGNFRQFYKFYLEEMCGIFQERILVLRQRYFCRSKKDVR